MTMPGEAAAGGFGPEAGRPLHIPDPLELHAAAFANAMAAQTVHWATEGARLPWRHWRTSPESLQTVPSMLRIGEDEDRGHPILLPLSGEGHVVIGNPRNNRPVHPAAVPSGTPRNEEAVFKQKAATAATKQNLLRTQRLERERVWATRASSGLMTRTLASTLPGAVRLTVYDPEGSGQEFTAFTPLADRDLFDLIDEPDTRQPQAELSVLLTSLNKEMTATNRQLRGYPTLRALAAAGHPLPKPWRVVTLLGKGEPLGASDRHLLGRLIQRGPDCGISLILHGFDLLNPPDVKGSRPISTRPWMTIGEDGYGHLDTLDQLGGVRVRLDPGPSDGIIAATAERAAQDVTRVEGAPTRGRIRQREEYARELPGVQYRAVLAENLALEGAAAREITTFNHHYPYLRPERLQGELSSANNAAYLKAAADAAASDMRALRAAREAFNDSGGTVIEQLQAWAALELVRDSPRHPLATGGALLFRGVAGQLVHRRVTALAQTIGITHRHGQELLPDAMREHVAAHLPEEPPAWAYQLVLDALIDANWRTRPEGSVRRSAPADAIAHLCYDLEQTYGVTGLRDENNRVLNPEFLTCLAQCRLLTLYEFEQATPELRTLLVRRVHRDLQRIEPEQIPDGLLPVYAQAIDHLRQIGGPIPTVRERTRGMLGSAASGLAGLVVPRRGKGTGEGLPDEGTEGSGLEGHDPVKR